MFKIFTFLKKRPQITCEKWIFRHISNDTIFSLSSGYGKCGVAVIRVSGPETKKSIRLLTKATPILENKCNNIKPNEILPRYAILKKIRHPHTNDLIDCGLVLWFPGPKSFTGEDCCEFQVHGSIAVVSTLCDALNSIDGLRPALAGEFTRRAFRANKLNLTEVEGLADLLNAETEIQRKQAMLQMSGALTDLYNDWRKSILHAVAYLEAYIDFGEDENIEDDTLQKVYLTVQTLIKDFENFLKDGRRGEMRKNGVKVAILGEPNVGKSSFMNYICQKPISIVANVEGTTRDIVETSFNIAGFPVLIGDTAGLRNHTIDPIESEGIVRAKNYASNADLIILVVDASKMDNNLNLNEFKKDYLLKLGIDEHECILDKEFIVIANKIDLVEQSLDKINKNIVLISCTQSKGIDKALDRIENVLRKLTDCDNSKIMTMNAPNDRHRFFLLKSLEHLHEFSRHTKENGFDYSIAALHLREAMQQLDNISGRIVNNEQIYDFIFHQFCIGK